MDESSKLTMMDILQRHCETYLHNVDSQWQLRLHTEEPMTKDTFYRILKALRSHKNLKEIPPAEYLEIRPQTLNCLDDVLSLQLYDRDSIQNYCLNEHLTNIGKWRWMKRTTYAQEALPSLYYVKQTSVVNQWVETADTSDIQAQMTEKMYRYIVQYKYTDKTDNVDYVMEVRKATQHAFPTMIAANVPYIPEHYVFKVIWRNTSLKKAKTTLTYTELARVLYRHSMLAMKILINEPELLSIAQKAAIMKTYGELVRKGRYIPRGREDDSASYFLAPKPVTLELPQLIEPGKAYCITSIQEHYAVTEKADGERMLLFVDPEGVVYLINNVPSPISTGLRCTNKAFLNSLLDGEYVDYEKRYGVSTSDTTKALFAVFDIYFVNGENVAGAPLIASKETSEYKGKARYDWIQRLCQESNWDTRHSTIDVRAKKHREGNGAELFKECAKLLKEAKQKKTWYPIDGLIFTPTRLPVLGYYPNTKVDFPYTMRWERVYKWKPAELNTIDFLVTKGMRIPVNGTHYQEFILKTGFNVDQMMDLDILKALNLLYDQSYRKQLHYGEGQYVPHIFRPFSYYEDGVHKAWIPEDENGNARAENGDILRHDIIVEFAYDRTDTRFVSYRWRPLRVREDKTRIYRMTDEFGNKTLSKTANDASTANNVWRSIHRPVTKDMIEGRIKVGEEEAPGCVEDRIQTDDDVYYAREIPRFHLLSRTMMNFHNMFIKNKLYAYPKIRNASLLELACGRAGDLKNWCNQRYGFVLGVDDSKANIYDPKEGSYARTIQTLIRKEQDVRSGKLDARFAYVPPVVYTVGDCSKSLRDGTAAMVKDDPQSVDTLQYLFQRKFPTRHPLYSIVPKLKGRAENGFDVVSCQFALHYFFQSRETLDGFFQNVSDNLKSGGYFIATFMDGMRVDAQLAGKPKVEGIVQETVIWAILKNYTDGAFSETRPFGNRIRVYLENINQLIPEYLIHFEFLVEFAATKGLRLIDSKTFDETFREEKNKTQTKSNQRILDEFEREHPTIRAFSELNRWVVFQKL